MPGFICVIKLPVYQTTATLLIKDDKNGSRLQDILEALDIFGSKKTVENEVEVLKSKTLMQEVVKNLHLYAPITVEGRVYQSICICIFSNSNRSKRS